MNPSYFSLNLKSSFMGFCAGIPLCLSFTLPLCKDVFNGWFGNTFQMYPKIY